MSSKFKLITKSEASTFATIAEKSLMWASVFPGYSSTVVILSVLSAFLFCTTTLEFVAQFVANW
jgi:hypothetical protein